MSVKKLRLKGVIYARYDDYANRLASGWIQKMIVDELRVEGYVLTTNYFSRCFSDARAKKLSKPVVALIAEKIPVEPELKPVVKKTTVQTAHEKGRFSIPVLSDDEMF